MQKEKEPWYLKNEFPDSDKNVEDRLNKFKKMANKKNIKNKFAYALGMLKKSYGK